MKSVLVTGGTGTFGRAFVRYALRTDVSRIVIYSRDEQKQEDMARELTPLDSTGRLRFFLGDVRDLSRLKMAMAGIDTVIHAAALKIVPKCEYDPIEAVRTNVNGAANVIEAAMHYNVEKVIALSTDKAVSPINLYGATKLTAERLFIAANNLSGSAGDRQAATKFSIARYGNVANSRGSVIPFFKKCVAEGRPLPITHPNMTRFWITIENAVDFVTYRLDEMEGGEVFIPKMPSFKILELAGAMAPNLPWEHVGIRPGEKIHETLVTPNDTPNLVYKDDHYIIQPSWRSQNNKLTDFSYSSNTNDDWLSIDDLKGLIA